MHPKQSSTCIILIALIIWSRKSVSNGFQWSTFSASFKPLTVASDSSEILCALDPPLKRVSLDVAAAVPSVVMCAMECERLGDSCRQFNSLEFSVGPERCQLYDKQPTRYGVVSGCQHYALPARHQGQYELYITGDDKIEELCIDGVPITNLPNNNTWKVPDLVRLPTIPRLIAVSLNNSRGLGGVLASDNAGHVSDSTWKCVDEAQSGWTGLDFDDSDWPAAVSQAANGNLTSTWFKSNRNRTVTNISMQASWLICNSSNVTVHYCRAHISPITKPTYQLSFTADSVLLDVYFDGVRYNNTPFSRLWNVADTVPLDRVPSLIAVAAQSSTSTHGILASDLAGRITNSSWKCTGTHNSNWMKLGYNDSAWLAALLQKNNSDPSSGWFTKNYRRPVDDIQQQASWIWQTDAPLSTNAYCRLWLSTPSNACDSSPCMNGETCTDVGVTFRCNCSDNAPSTWNCVSAPITHMLNITVDDSVVDLYLDSFRYDVPNADQFNVIGTVTVDFRPTMIAVYAWDSDGLFGVLASDNYGLVTGADWKCTKTFPGQDWMLVSFNDSAWPAASVMGRNGDTKAQFNVLYNGNKPLDGISLDAYWIWAAEYNPTPYNYVYCRSPRLQ